MNKISTSQLGAIPETALVALFYRALDSQEPEPILNDPCAARFVEQLDYDFSSVNPSPMSRIFTMIRLRQFDRQVAAFVAAGHPNPVVVEIGCGLDTRYERMQCPDVTWYSLDLPAVIDLRRKLLDNHPNCTDLASSAFDLDWLDSLPPRAGRSFLFMAEGVFEYFPEADVRRLVLAIRDRFPGAELLFSATPYVEQWLSSLHPALRGQQARVRWGLRADSDVEHWAPGIRLLEKWWYFDDPGPYMRPYRWVAWVPGFGKEWRILRYRLGDEK